MSHNPPEMVQMLNCGRGFKEVLALMLSEEKLNVLSTNERETWHSNRTVQREASEFKMRSVRQTEQPQRKHRERKSHPAQRWNFSTSRAHQVERKLKRKAESWRLMSVHELMIFGIPEMGSGVAFQRPFGYQLVNLWIIHTEYHACGHMGEDQGTQGKVSWQFWGRKHD